MAEEQAMENGQEALAEDFNFDRDETLFDDSGNPINEPTPAKTGNQPAQAEPVAKGAAPAAQGTPAAGASQGNEPNKDGKTQDELERAFYKTDDKGNVSFDADAALNLFGSKESGFKASPVFNLPAEAPTQTKDDVPEWRKEIEAEKEYKESLRGNMFLYQKYFQEFRNQGYDEETAMAGAAQALDKFLGEHFTEREYNSKLTKREQEEKVIEEKRAYAEVEAKAVANEQLFAAKVGGIEKYNKIMFDRKYGGDYILKQFRNMNPDFKPASKQEYDQKLAKWWTHFSADEDNLRMMYAVAEAKLIKQMLPDLMKHARSVKANGEQALSLRSVNPGANISRPAMQKTKQDSLDVYLGRNVEENEEVLEV